MTVTDAGGNFKKVPAGNHLAVCTQLIDLGTSDQTYLGVTKHLPKIMVIWEIPDENDLNEPYLVNKEYTKTICEKANLRKDLESWRGKPFDEIELKGFELKNLLNKCCLLNIIYKPNSSYPTITTVASLPKGTEQIKPQTEILFLSFEDLPYQMNVYEKLPQFIKNKIIKSDEWLAVNGIETHNTSIDYGEDVPF